ncbi:MAG TPA: GDSL-type esterase/lipase family protein [Armatimonadota bacterium]|jgi:lysophospholipase L1-like esterase
MNHPRIACLALVSLCAVPAIAQTAGGPKPTPAGSKDWPGKGYAGAYPLWVERRAAFWKDREKDQGAVVFFGDSITQGWRTVDKAFPTLKVANRGISSDTSKGLLWRLQEDVLDLHPRAVVMLIGINDIAGGVSPSDVAWNIRAMVDRMRAANPKMPVILCKVMPWKEVPGKSPSRVMQTNALIESIAIGRPQVAVCDTFSPFATSEGVCRKEEFPDLLHPNEAGHVKWTAALTPVMKKMGIL